GPPDGIADNPGRAHGRMNGRAASWKRGLTSIPKGVKQFSDRVDDPAADSEQDHPYQIVDLLLEIGKCQFHRLRSAEEDGSQEQDDRYRSHKNCDQLVHNGCSSLWRAVAGHAAPPTDVELAALGSS